MRGWLTPKATATSIWRPRAETYSQGNWIPGVEEGAARAPRSSIRRQLKFVRGSSSFAVVCWFLVDFIDATFSHWDTLLHARSVTQSLTQTRRPRGYRGRNTSPCSSCTGAANARICARGASSSKSINSTSSPRSVSAAMARCSWRESRSRAQENEEMDAVQYV